MAHKHLRQRDQINAALIITSHISNKTIEANLIQVIMQRKKKKKKNQTICHAVVIIYTNRKKSILKRIYIFILID